MCIRITFSIHIPAAVNKVVCGLSGNNRVQHNGEIAAGWILHTCRYIKTAGYETMLLVFNRTGTDGNVGEDVCQIPVILRIKHLISNWHTIGFKCMHMHLSDRNDSLKKIRCFLRIRLMEHSFITFTGCTRFIRINTRDNDYLVFNLFLDFCQTFDIFTYRFFIICRTRSDNGKKLVRFSGNNINKLLIQRTFFFSKCGTYRIQFFNFLRNR